MNRANPADLRRALQIANEYTKAGILFVCVPVTGDADHVYLANMAQRRLNKIVDDAEKEEVSR